ncbi:MAG: hypothetical protein AABX47_03305 [Nanoarchaeota archaeon]
MKSRLLFGIFGILLMALVACAPRPTGPVAPVASAPAAAPAPAPAPAPAQAPEPAKPVETQATPAPAEEPTTSVEAKPAEEKEWGSSIPPKQNNLTPVETENKYAGEQGGYVASVDCGVKDGIGTLSVTVQNPTDQVLKLGSRPQVFGGGNEMLALIVNGRHVMEVMRCEPGLELKPGDKTTCTATSPVDDRYQWVMIRHGLSALGNPMPNTVQMYSPGKGRERVEFLC